MKRIDAHSHYYPERYLKELRKYGITKTVGIPLTKVKADSIENRLEEQEMNQINAEVLGLSSPSVYFPDKEFSRSLAQLVITQMASGTY